MMNDAPPGVRGTVPRSTLSSLPLLDELRTYCYEHQTEEIPALLAV
jgi:hypothetical protein